MTLTRIAGALGLTVAMSMSGWAASTVDVKTVPNNVPTHAYIQGYSVRLGCDARSRKGPITTTRNHRVR